MEINALVVAGQSTADLPFKVYVEANDGFRAPKKKNRLIETDYMTGALKEEIKAWSVIEKSYVLYCPFASLKELRQLKLWAKDHGKLTPADEPDVYYEILDVELGHARVDEISGYRVEVTFYCEPFGYEREWSTRSYQSGQQLINETNAPMFPRITAYGNTSSEAMVRIGQQRLYFERVHTKVDVECKPGQQDVFNQNGSVSNGLMRGEFFEVMPGSNEIELSGISRIVVLERWAWV